MKSLIKKLPIAISGLMLALAASGNMIQSYGEIYRTLLGAASTVILLLLLLLLKILIYPHIVKDELENPLVASVFPTFTMGIMLLSTYFKPLAPNISFIIWLFAVIGHGLLILNFSLKHILKFDLKKVFPSWFIVYVGIVVASVTAPAFQMQTLGKIIFWIGICSYFLLLPLVVKRSKLKNIPEPALPSIAIYTAPLALCLAGYLNSFENKSMLIVWTLVILSQVNYIFVLYKLPKLIKLKFYPSFSAFTFPLVISALSLKLTNGYLIKTDPSIYILKYLVYFEEMLAFIVVLYVLFKYIEFLLISLKANLTSEIV